MKTAQDINDIIAYKAQIVEQQKALKDSNAFTDLEKVNLENCYEYQIGICDAKINEVKKLFPFLELEEATQV